VSSEHAPERETSQVPELDRLLLRALEEFELRGDEGVEALCAAHPSLADALRGRIELLRSAGVWQQNESPLADEAIPERLGEFRIERLLGVGGMGVVYLALQESLGRRVALKIVRPELVFFPSARERFQREVKTVAQLQHPGIVPIYSVGEHQGIPFFAMEYIVGRTLDAALSELRTKNVAQVSGRDLAPSASGSDWLFEGSWEEVCLRVVRQIAEALEHAHQRGVLHRDIKPSNILLASEGTSRALLFDFGLASSTGASRLTRSGSRLGSLHYMSPEQTRDATVDARSDVYSLGVTLYELLTLQRAFTGTSDLDVLHAIAQARRRRPKELNPNLSTQAEIVCLTAMDVDPERRYASAAAFARDLANVLEHRPIEASRASAWVVAAGWIRRHPSRSIALALATVFGLGTPLLYAWQQRRAARLIAVQRDRAEDNFEQSLLTVDRLLGRVGAEELRYVPQMEKVRRALLEDAIGLLESFATSAEDGSKAQSEIARAYARLGALHGELGNSQSATEALARSVAILESLQTDAPEDFDLRRRLVESRLEWSKALVVAGRAQEALDVHGRNAVDLQALFAIDPEDRELHQLSLRIDLQSARIWANTGQNLLAREGFASAFAKANALATTSDRELSVLELQRDAGSEFGLLLLQHFSSEGRLDPEALSTLERTEACAARLAELEPNHGGYRHAHAMALVNLGGAHRRAHSFEEVLPLYTQAGALLRKLAEDFPDVLSYAVDLAGIENQLGLLTEASESARVGQDIRDAERLEQCAAHYRDAFDRLERVIARAPREPEFRQRAGIAGYNLSTALQFADVPEARRVVARAIVHQRVAVELAALDPVVREDLRALLVREASLCLKMGEHAESGRICAEIASVLPDDSEGYRSAAYRLCRGVAHVRERTDLNDSARDELVRAYSAQSVGYLRAALEHGYQPSSPLDQHEDFEPLRGTPAFDAFLAEIQ
jgi:serine/threonine protein kinase/tetratricopeptide (TPR) repeat protein